MAIRVVNAYKLIITNVSVKYAASYEHTSSKPWKWRQHLLTMKNTTCPQDPEKPHTTVTSVTRHTKLHVFHVHGRNLLPPTLSIRFTDRKGTNLGHKAQSLNLRNLTSIYRIQSIPSHTINISTKRPVTTRGPLHYYNRLTQNALPFWFADQTFYGFITSSACYTRRQCTLIIKHV
jgi:hypothetical protein